jgi:hypothetical protein
VRWPGAAPHTSACLPRGSVRSRQSWRGPRQPPRQLKSPSSAGSAPIVRYLPAAIEPGSAERACLVLRSRLPRGLLATTPVFTRARSVGPEECGNAPASQAGNPHPCTLIRGLARSQPSGHRLPTAGQLQGRSPTVRNANVAPREPPRRHLRRAAMSYEMGDALLLLSRAIADDEAAVCAVRIGYIVVVRDFLHLHDAARARREACSQARARRRCRCRCSCWRRGWRRCN